MTAFLSINLLYTSALMSVINYIDCKMEKKIIASAFAPSMFCKSSFANNILVFEDFNIMEMGLEKTDIRWSN